VKPKQSRFARNISARGRWIRATIAAGFFIAAVFEWSRCYWMAGLFLAAGAFVAFEALRGWCALRACGVRTKF
jgi:hypothetical protein